jgi:YVTN family beta-propeller protein
MVLEDYSKALIKTIDVGQYPNDIAFNPRNNNMYVANRGSTTVSVVDGSTNEVVDTISVGSFPISIAFNPSNNDMYVANLGSDTVSVIDSSRNTVVDTIPVGTRPQGIAFNPSNNDMYVTKQISDTVSVIDSSMNTVVNTIPVGAFPIGIAFNPRNNDMYVTNAHSNTVSVIATTLPIQPPTQTTITSVIDGNGNTVQNKSSTASRSITFQVTATRGTNPIVGFECSLDGSAFSSCTTANSGTISYDNLAAGQQHTFEVGAVDSAGNKDPTPATFSWTIFTPKQAIQNLINTIDNMHLSKITTIRLEAPLHIAIKLLNYHQTFYACYIMNAFLQIVKADALIGQITHQQAAELKQQATAIQGELGCSSSYTLPSSLIVPSPLS